MNVTGWLVDDRTKSEQGGYTEPDPVLLGSVFVLSSRLLALITLVAAVLASGLLAGCSRTGTSSVRITAVGSPAAGTALSEGPSANGGKLTLAVPAGLQDRVAQLLLAAGQTRASFQIVAEGAPADVNIAVAQPNDAGAPILRRWSVATSAARIDVDSVSLASLTQAASTGTLYVAQAQAALIAPMFADHAGLKPIADAEIPAHLAAEPAALAILPADTMTVQVRALALDGVDPVRGEGDLAAYPLVTRVQVRAGRPGKDADALVRSLSAALTRPDPAPLRLAFTGDLIPTRCVYDQMRAAGDFAAPFRAVAGRLQKADLAVGSLDASISDVGAPIGCHETFNLLAPPEVVQGFTLAGLKVITVAANHAKDCGMAGACADAAFLDTLKNLRAAGIQPAGGGATLTEARRPAVVTVGGVRFAFLGYDDIAPYYHATDQSAGTAGLDLQTLPDDIRAARQVADVVIVLPHWGIEYTPDPSQRQQEAARTAIQAGATLIVGNHPHVVEAAGPLGDGYVAYALGNFVFDQDWSVETTEGVMLEATFQSSRLAAVRYLPIQIQNRLQPVFLSPADGQHILQRMIDATARLPKN